MASLNRWIVVGVVACVAIALAYVPPRGAKSSHRSPFFMQMPQGTPARQRAQALAEEWRGADLSLRLLTARRDLAERLRTARTNGRSLLVFAESSDALVVPPAIVDSAAHLAWRQLGLTETKIGVILIIELANATRAYSRPVIEEGVATYLAPDSTYRTTCLAVVPTSRYWNRYFAGDRRGQARDPFPVLVELIEGGFGPCAFYAAYGTPSRIVRGWLAAHNWDLALHLDEGPRGLQQGSLYGIADQRYSWYWDAIYSLPPTGVGCLARRADACRAAVLSGSSDDPLVPTPDIMHMTRRWDHAPRLVEAQRFLGDVARAVGRDRFLDFWTSSAPVDTALTAALKRPVGKWTADWESDFARPIRLGPTAPLGAVGIAFAMTVFAIAIVTITASRRQVR